MPLAPGHVERFRSFPGVDFCQGVHPLALRPGDPVFLSDRCDVGYVEESLRRYQEPCPEALRSVVWVKDEYVVLHDDLYLPPAMESYWHLQIVAESYTVDPDSGYRFRGRFGTDLQVLLPGQTFEAQRVDWVPILDYHRPPEQCFAMEHLALAGGAQRPGYLAVLRPLNADGREVSARRLSIDDRAVGVHVQADGLDETLWLASKKLEYGREDVDFSGRYGMALARGHVKTLVLVDGTHLRSGACEIISDGPAVSAAFGIGACRLVAEGRGMVRVRRGTSERRVTVEGCTTVDLDV